MSYTSLWGGWLSWEFSLGGSCLLIKVLWFCLDPLGQDCCLLRSGVFTHLQKVIRLHGFGSLSWSLLGTLSWWWVEENGFNWTLINWRGGCLRGCPDKSSRTELLNFCPLRKRTNLLTFNLEVQENKDHTHLYHFLKTCLYPV